MDVNLSSQNMVPDWSSFSSLPGWDSSLGGTSGAGAGAAVPGLGLNVPTAQLALSGLGTLGSLWAAWQGSKLAKQQFNFTKDVTNTNLANQIKSYNTALSDRARTRSFVEGDPAGYADSYYNANKLDRHPTNGG